MKSHLFIATLALASLPLFAHADCGIVKADIDAKIKANNVSNYTLQLMTSDEADKSNGKVVGQCEGNKYIVYSRGPSGHSDSAPKSPPPAAEGAGQTGG